MDEAKDVANLKEINACICKFYKKLFKKNVSKSYSERELFLNSIALPNLNSKSFDICESEITEKHLKQHSTLCPAVNPLGMMI